MKRKCDTCRACELLKEPEGEIIGYCHNDPPKKVIYSDGSRIEFVGVTPAFYCMKHKFRAWSWRWVVSLEFLRGSK